MRELLKEVAQDPLAMFYAVLVHVALAAVLFVGLELHETPLPAASPKVNVVQAVAINEQQVQAELDKLKKAESQQQKTVEAQREKEETRKRKLEREMRETEKKRKAEEQRLTQLKKERETENQRQKEAEKKRKAEAKRLAAKKAEEQKKLERLKVEQAALEKKRQAEEKRLAEMAVKRQQEQEAARKRAEEESKRREREAAMRAEIAAEQAQLDAAKQRRLNSLRMQYIAAIAGKVERHWLKPPSARVGLSCKVRVKQIPGGEVVDVQVTQCTGDDTFRRSVEKAVKKSSPLPMPKDPRLFEREIIFNFKPQ
ncbi:MAG: cell envelope integrity protein TolA [Gammaproteobacteria bacterium]|nr:cell envelope integrity protein TolA [Gammaproteobacteria bacterium]